MDCARPVLVQNDLLVNSKLEYFMFMQFNFLSDFCKLAMDKFRELGAHAVDGIKLVLSELTNEALVSLNFFIKLVVVLDYFLNF